MMNTQAMTSTDNKPKANVKNLQFIEQLDKLIDQVEEAEERDEVIEGNRRNSCELVNLRYRYVSRYDWYDSIFEENGKKGLKDVKGEVVVPAKYDDFQECCHYVYAHDIPRVAILQGKAGLVKANGSGEELTAFEYDSMAFMMIEPYYTVRKGSKYGIVGMDGREIVPCILDEIFHPSGNCVVFKADGKYGLLDSSCNDLYVEPIYDDIEYIDLEQPYAVTKDGVEGVINEKGEFMTDEESVDYEGYLVGEYEPNF